MDLGIGMYSTGDSSQFDAYVDYLLSVGVRHLRVDIPEWNIDLVAQSKAAVIRAVAKGAKVIWGLSSFGTTLTAANWGAYATAVTDAAAWAQANGVSEFHIGNELDTHIDNTTLTYGQLRTNLRTLATAVQAIYTIGPVSYSFIGRDTGLINSWSTEGRGDVDILNGNFYRGTTTFDGVWATNAQLLMTLFGPNHSGITEFGSSTVDPDLYGTEAEQAVGVADMLTQFAAMGYKQAVYYAWNSDPFGVVLDYPAFQSFNPPALWGEITSRVPTRWAGPAGRSWYSDLWRYRLTLRIPATSLTADLADFPVYVDLADLPAAFHAHCNQTDARDIRVTLSDGVTELPRELVYYDADKDAGEMYFKATLSHSVDNIFYIYYDNPAATDYAVNYAYGTQNVWNAGYAMVHHLDGAERAAILDSTAGDHDASADAGSPTYQAATRLGRGVAFGTGKTITIPSCATAWAALTIELWMRTSAGYKKFFDKGTVLRLGADATGLKYMQATANNAWGTKIAVGATTITTNNPKWWSLAGVYDGSQLLAYVNGVQDGVVTGVSGNVTNTTDVFVLATDFLGALDEVRLSSVARSAAWLAACCKNMDNPLTFYSVENEHEKVARSFPVLARFPALRP